MPLQGPSAPVQEGFSTASNPPGDASTANFSRAQKDTGKNKPPRGEVAFDIDSVESVDATAPHRAQYPYEPYRKAGTTPGPEGNLPAAPDALETLDATAKIIYKSDREILEYIKSLKLRTAATLEHINRTDAQLRASNGAMERIEFFASHRQEVYHPLAVQPLFGIGAPRTDWKGDEMVTLDPDEPTGEGSNARHPDPLPNMARGEHGAFPAIDEQPPKNTNRPSSFYDLDQDALSESAPQPPNVDGDNGLEYAEDEAPFDSRPPDHAPLGLDDSTLNRLGGDRHDHSQNSPPPDTQLFGTSERDIVDITAAPPVQPPVNPSRDSHPPTRPHTSPPQGLKRKRVSTPDDDEADNDPGNFVDPTTALAPHQLGDKRDGVPVKRQRLITRQPSWECQMFAEAGLVDTPAHAEPPTRTNSPVPSHQPHGVDKRRLITRQPSWDYPMFVEAGWADPPAHAEPPTRENSPVPSHQPHGKKGGVPVDKRRLITRQPTWDYPMFVEAGLVDPPAHAEPPTRANSPVPSHQPHGVDKRRLITRQPSWDYQMFVEAGWADPPAHADHPTRGNSPEPSHESVNRRAPSPSIPTSRLQKEDSENERSQVIELLSREIEQGGSEDEEEPTGNILAGLRQVGTPPQSQVPAEVQAPVPGDVFGPIVLSAKADKTQGPLPTEVSRKDSAGGTIVPSAGREIVTRASVGSARFDTGDEAEEKVHRVFRKTPSRPRSSLRVAEAENALVAEVKAESPDEPKPLPRPRKKRAVGARARKPKATPSVKIEEAELPSVPAPTSEPPTKPKRGRSKTAPVELKAPVRRSARNKK